MERGLLMRVDLPHLDKLYISDIVDLWNNYSWKSLHTVLNWGIRTFVKDAVILLLIYVIHLNDGCGYSWTYFYVPSDSTIGTRDQGVDCIQSCNLFQWKFWLQWYVHFCRVLFFFFFLNLLSHIGFNAWDLLGTRVVVVLY